MDGRGRLFERFVRARLVGDDCVAASYVPEARRWPEHGALPADVLPISAPQSHFDCRAVLHRRRQLRLVLGSHLYGYKLRCFSVRFFGVFEKSSFPGEELVTVQSALATKLGNTHSAQVLLANQPSPFHPCLGLASSHPSRLHPTADRHKMPITYRSRNIRRNRKSMPELT